MIPVLLWFDLRSRSSGVPFTKGMTNDQLLCFRSCDKKKSTKCRWLECAKPTRHCSRSRPHHSTFSYRPALLQYHNVRISHHHTLAEHNRRNHEVLCSRRILSRHHRHRRCRLRWKPPSSCSNGGRMCRRNLGMCTRCRSSRIVRQLGLEEWVACGTGLREEAPVFERYVSLPHISGIFVRTSFVRSFDLLTICHVCSFHSFNRQRVRSWQTTTAPAVAASPSTTDSTLARTGP